MNFKNVQNATNQLEKNLRKWKESEGCFDLKFVNEPHYYNIMPERMAKDLAKWWENSRKRQILEELCQSTEEGGADLNYLEKKRGFALIPNVFWNVEFIKFFVERGMDVNSRDEHGDTPLHLAVRHAHVSLRYYDAVSVLNYLLNELSADPNIPNLKGDTALFTLAQSPIYSGKDFKLKLAKMLMEKGAIMASFRLDAAEHINYLMSHELKIKSEYFSSTVPDQYLMDSSKPPAKHAERLEYDGAGEFLDYVYYNKFYGSHDGFYYWDQAMDVYKRFDLEPSKEFSANYTFFRANLNNLGAREEIFMAALNTVARLSEGIHSRFWNLLSTTVEPDRFILQIDYFFHTVNFMASLKENYFERIEDFASSNEYYSLPRVVENFKVWLRRRVNLQMQPEEDRISHLHSIARLTIACFRKSLHQTKCKNLSDCGCMNLELYVTLIYVLTFLHSRLGDVIPVATFNENERLLTHLIGLDLRANDGDSLMHVILKDNYYEYRYFRIKFELDLILVLSEFANLKVEDVAGFEPSQYIKWNKKKTKEAKLKLIIKFADRGAHIDYKNAFGGPTFKDVLDKERPKLSFKYDSLQCVCARFLAGSLLPYNTDGLLPKCMVDFIRMHSSYKFYSN